MTDDQAPPVAVRTPCALSVAAMARDGRCASGSTMSLRLAAKALERAFRIAGVVGDPSF